MRFVRAASLVAATVLTTAAAAQAAAPPGFYESRVLEPAASFVAQRPVRIYCSLTLTGFRDYARSQGGSSDATGIRISEDAAGLAQPLCTALRSRLKRRHNVDGFDLAAGMLVLVHESLHLRGLRDEGETECRAIRLMPQVAVRYFGYSFKYRKPLRSLMADAWQSHRLKPAAYTADC